MSPPAPPAVIPPDQLRAELAAHGYAILPGPARLPAEPWSFVHELLGVRPELVERQPIRPVPGARSFAGTSGFTPFHTDSQDFLGAPPGLQIMVCRRAAAQGGETRLLDGWALLEHLALTEPALHQALLAVPRLHRFYFGDVTRPTVAEVRGHLAWTHSPQPPADPIGAALELALQRAPVIQLAIQTGQTLLVDNHRMLHGRAAFDDPARHFERLLAWLPAPLSRHPRYRALHAPAPAGGPLALVLELLTGVPPARIAAREGLTESQLYALRNRALAAAAAALAGAAASPRRR